MKKFIKTFLILFIFILSIKVNADDLSSIKINGTLLEDFQSNKYTYVINVDANASMINIQATNNTGAKMEGLGDFNLDYGTNNLKIESIGRITDEYELIINRYDPRSVTNTIKSLNLSCYDLDFNSNKIEYSIRVSSKTPDCEIKINLTDPYKSRLLEEYGERNTYLDFGYNKVEIKVAAENEVVKTYTINITREIDEEYTLGDLQSDNLLKAIEIPGYDIDFNPSINEYNIILKDDEKTLTVKGILSSDKATFRDGYGNTEINVTKATTYMVQLIVVAENGAENTYTFNFIKKSNKKYIDAVAISNYKFDFDENITDYNLSLNDNDTELLFSYILIDPLNSTIEITGNENLKVGSVVTLKYIKDDYTQEYKINIVEKQIEETNKASEEKYGIGVKITCYVFLAVSIALVVLAVLHFRKKKKIESM